MLRSMRNNAKNGWLKFILMGFMLLAVGGLVLTDVGGFFRGGLPNNIVAKGDGFEIGLNEFNSEVRTTLLQQGMTPNEAYQSGLIQRLLRGEIQARLFAREARNSGIVIDNDILAERLEEVTQNFPVAEGQSRSDALRSALRAQGVTETQFLADLRRQMAVDLLQAAFIANGLSLPEEQAIALYKYENEMRTFRGFELNPADFPAELSGEGSEENTADSDAQLEQYYRANIADYRVPERRNLTVLQINAEQVAENYELTEEELREYYDDNEDQFTVPEKRLIRQAALQDQAQASQVIDTMTRQGNTMEEAVQLVTGAADAYLGENSFARASLIDQIAEPVFSADEKSLIGPIETPAGWAVIGVEEIIPENVIPFAEAREDIRTNLIAERLGGRLIDLANTLDDRLASGESPDSIIEDMDLETFSVENINMAGLNPEDNDLAQAFEGDRGTFLETAFDTPENEVSPVQEDQQAGYYAVWVTDVEEAFERPLDEVREDVFARWESEKRRLAAQAQAQDILAALNEGQDVETIASQNDIDAENYYDLSRSAAGQYGLSLPALRQIFEAEPETPIALEMQNADGQTVYITGMVTDITLPDTQGVEDEIESIIQNYNQIYAQEILGQYLAFLSEKYNVEINETLLQQAYGANPQGAGV